MFDTLDSLMKIHPPGTKFTCGKHYNFECWFKIGSTWHDGSRARELLEKWGKRC